MLKLFKQKKWSNYALNWIPTKLNSRENQAFFVYRENWFREIQLLKTMYDLIAKIFENIFAISEFCSENFECSDVQYFEAADDKHLVAWNDGHCMM